MGHTFVSLRLRLRVIILNSFDKEKGELSTLVPLRGFWSQLKRSIDETFHTVSPKHLQAYVDEYSHRDSGLPMFSWLLARIYSAAEEIVEVFFDRLLVIKIN